MYKDLNFLLNLVNEKTLILGGKIGYKKNHEYTTELSKIIYDLIEEINPSVIIIIHLTYINLYYEYGILDKKRLPDIIFTNPRLLCKNHWRFKDYERVKMCQNYGCEHKDSFETLNYLIKKNINLKTIFSHDHEIYDDIINNNDNNEIINCLKSSYPHLLYENFKKYYLSNNFYHTNTFFQKLNIDGNVYKNIATTGFNIIQLLVNNGIKPYIIGFDTNSKKDSSYTNQKKADGYTYHNYNLEADSLFSWHNSNKIISLDILGEKLLQSQSGGNKIYKINYSSSHI